MQPVPQWPDAAQVFATVDGIYRRESRRVFATVIRLLGNFDIDEKALHDAFKSAVEQWPRIGIPNNPQAWLLSALQAVETATTVRLRNCQLSLTDGPFAESKEPLAGFYTIDAKDLNEVIHWATKFRRSDLAASKCGRCGRWKTARQCPHPPETQQLAAIRIGLAGSAEGR